jgi:hypothetical protein
MRQDGTSTGESNVTAPVIMTGTARSPVELADVIWNCRPSPFAVEHPLFKFTRDDFARLFLSKRQPRSGR